MTAPARKGSDVRFVTRNDFEDLIQARTHLAIKPSELRQERWANVDFVRHQITVDMPKDLHTPRGVPLGRETMRILESRHKRAPDSK